MKKMTVLIAAVLALSASATFAADHEGHDHGSMGMDMGSHEGMKMDTADGARECALQAESIQAKIRRLNAEVAKGSKKYSAVELKKLEKKLKEANEILDQLTRN